jgi:hypothetical protein
MNVENECPPQTHENAPNGGAIIFLTSFRHLAHNPSRLMEMQQIETSEPQPKKQATAYPLRFKNKTQKERLARAARKVGKSLRDFILHSAEQAASALDQPS